MYISKAAKLQFYIVFLSFEGNKSVVVVVGRKSCWTTETSKEKSSIPETQHGPSLSLKSFFGASNPDMEILECPKVLPTGPRVQSHEHET